MQKVIDDGGYAFPQQEPTGMATLTNDGMFQPHCQVTGGITLRDWFAAQALAGYFAAPSTPHRNATDCAIYMYEMADAMIAARKVQ